MATTTDVSESSDIVHEFPCKPCADDGKIIEGVDFCGECQTYFCHGCVQFHNKCFKTHTIFNKSGVKSGKIQHEPQQGGLACEKHAGNLIQMYCGEHDTVCCAVCIAVDHRLCKSADFIPKLAKEILNGRDRKDVKTSLERIRKQLHDLKACKLEQIKGVKKEKDENMKEIAKMKEYIIVRVEEIEQSSVQKVQEKHDRIVGNIKTDIENIDAKLNAVERNIDKINTFKGDNEAKLFVVLNRAHEVEVDSCIFFDKNGSMKYDKIEFKINPNISTFVSKIEAFGSIKGDVCRASGSLLATNPPISDASLVKKISIGGSDTCMLDNGQIIIVVFNGLKRFDNTYEYLDECNLANGRSVCKVGPTEIAVLCSSDKITYVDAGKSLVVTHSFEMSKKEYIYPVVSGQNITCISTASGISCSNGKLVVCVKISYCGAYDFKNRCNPQSCKTVVSIYDLKGNHIETCIVPIDNEIKIYYTTYSSRDSCVYIATNEKGLLVFDMTSKKLKTITNKRLKSPSYVCKGRKGQMFVCGMDSHNVFLVDRESDNMTEILGSLDGIWKPRSVMYIEQQNCLLVTCAPEETKVYQLK